MRNPDEYVEKAENRIYGASNTVYLTIAAIGTFFLIAYIWVSGF